MPSTVSTAKPMLLGELIQTDLTHEYVNGKEPSLPTHLEARIAYEVAKLWHVPTDEVTIQWGAIPDENSLTDETEFRLIGRGLDSWFAVVFECETRPAFATRMRAGLYRDIAVALRDLRSGDTLTSGDYKLRCDTRWGPPLRNEPLVAGPGWLVKNTIAAGQVVAEPQAVPVPVIQEGERVRLTWRRGMVTVSVEGFALHPAATGQRVHVQLKGRRGKSSGIVTGKGQARLDS